MNELALISYLLNPDLMGMQPQTYESGEAFFQERTAKNNVAGAEINLAYSYGNMINVLAGFMYEKHTISNIKTISNGNFLFDQPMILGDQVFQGAESLGGTRDVSAEYNWLQERDRTIYAVFGQAEFNFKNMLKLFSFEHVKLVTGVRFDDYSDVGGKVNPRLGLLVAPSRKVYFKGLFGQAFRAPSMVELYTQNSPVADGDPNLLPETVRTFEAVLGYQAGKRLDANLTYFNTRIFDNIQLSEDDDPRTPLRAVYSNAGNLRTSGVEGEAKWWFNKQENGYLSGSFTIQNVLDFTRDTLLALNRNTGEVLTEVQGDFDPGNSPDFLLNLTLNYPITQNISLNVNANHIAERKRTEALQFEVDDAFRPTGEIIQTDNRPAIPARTLVNASVILKDLKFAPKLTFQLTGYNILDEVNDNPTFRIRGDDLLREGINWTSSLIYQF
ncbi:MAG: TonB-dependent receptor [Bacteroidota bacterium]